MGDSVLVFGASGQLGGAILHELCRCGKHPIAFSRSRGSFPPHISSKIEIVEGDLSNFDSVRSACARADRVIATASSIVPRKHDRFGVDDVNYYRNIVRACKESGIERLIYISAFPTPYDEQIPEFQIKREIEQLILESGVPYTIFRGAAFMDIYFAVMGSRIVSEGVAQPTLMRGFWLTRLYSALTSGLLENHGIALLPGNGKARQAFISVEDVARVMVRALDLDASRNRIEELGGPEALSWREVAETYASVLDRKVRKVVLPLWLLRLLRFSLAPFSPAGANIMAILWLLGRYDYTPDMQQLSSQYGVELTATESFLRGKLDSVRGL
jgi:NADH dehydrogenase